jgi:hypothetical protein
VAIDHVVWQTITWCGSRSRGVAGDHVVVTVSVPFAMLLVPMHDCEQTLTVLSVRCSKQITQAIWLGAYDL